MGQADEKGRKYVTLVTTQAEVGLTKRFFVCARLKVVVPQRCSCLLYTSIQRNEETHQTVLTAMGDTQVDMLISRCKEQTGVDVRLVPVRIPYRETIRKTAEAEGRHKKQTGGAGQFGDCWLRISPNPVSYTHLAADRRRSRR